MISHVVIGVLLVLGGFIAGAYALVRLALPSAEDIKAIKKALINR